MFNEIIRWPAQSDLDFPNLRDSSSSVVTPYQRFYAAHYNKIRAFAVKAYGLSNSFSTVASDNSINKISAPVVVELTLNELVKAGAFDVTETTNKLPGNYLPFQVVITSSSQDYTSLKAKVPVMLIQGSLVGLKRVFYTLNPLVKLFTTVNVRPNVGEGFSSTSSLIGVDSISSTCVGNGTVLVRGAIVDKRISPQGGLSGVGSDLWESSTFVNSKLRLTLVVID